LKATLAAINCQKTEIERNFEIHERTIVEAADQVCDIVVFPEMSLTGYLDPAVHSVYELTLESNVVDSLVRLTESYSVDALFGIAEKNPVGGPFISQIHASDGNIVGVYRKRNLADNEALFSPGADAYIGEVSNVAFGVAVCADYTVDTEFIAASTNGASLVFHPAAPGLYGPRRTDEQSWRAGFDWWRDSCIEKNGRHAKTNNVNVAVCTQAGATVDEDFPGWAALIGPDGEIVAELPDWREGKLVIEV